MQWEKSVTMEQYLFGRISGFIKGTHDNYHKSQQI